MERLTAYCGLDCAEWDAFQATQADDDELRAQVAAQWSEESGHAFSAEDINCDGCTVGKREVPFLHKCAIRNCGRERGVANCAHCAEFACERLEQVFDNSPDARANLEGIRKAIG